ncbi:MFS transporter [Streptomyces sp. A3M-1-3]|uniref:MFS transporter n=1 Tax=Streptomyces sp. A3M-1-3 TaxID=2962044 RepID=UPI0020B83867|nr:MFS transporter [Streptomyces sp. A3M-1-3]MCP3822798.1 MFS transporter [Streptomyces sp. A3M-1-3]
MSSNAASASAASLRASPRQWFGLAILLLPTMLMTADLGVLWLATPYLAADLQPSSSQLLWTTDIYGFMTAGFLVIMGTMGDRIGRRRLLMIGAVGFIIASLIAAYSTSPEMLIAARGVLGVAGAAVLPSTLSLISHMFADPRQRATAIAMWVTALSVGLAIGPVIGGGLLASWWWGSVFLIGVPVMLLALVTAPVLLPEYRDPNAGRLDLTSVALFLLGILPVVYGIKRIAEYGLSWQVGLAFVAGAVFSVLFARRQGRLASPLLDLRLFSNRGFTGALLTLLFGMTALNGVEYLVPQYLQQVAGQTALGAGLWLLPGAVGLILGSQLTPVLARRVRPAYVLLVGTLVSLVGYWMTAQVGSDDSGVVLASVALAVIMLGVAPISVLGTALAVGSSEPEKAGSAAATGQTAYDLGLAMGIAVSGSVAVAVYRSEVADSAPSGVPAAAAEAARDTLGGAAAAAARLPGELGNDLLISAREAFTTGLHTAAFVSVGFALATAVLIFTLLRHIPAFGSQETAPEAVESGAPEAQPTNKVPTH